jgi:1-acyl-sn-glycerol-3-phosphate acyltransferase
MLYRIGRIIVGAVLHIIFRRRFIGVENVPAEGGVIFAVNHRSYWDVILAGLACPRPLRFMAKSELFSNKLFGSLIRALGAFPVKRGRGDIGAVRSSIKILSDNEVLLMFPEGRRVRGGYVTDAKPGVAMIATAAKVPVIPVNISGKYKWMNKITVTIGKPITFKDYYDKKLTMQELQNLSNCVLKSIRSLEP